MAIGRAWPRRRCQAEDAIEPSITVKTIRGAVWTVGSGIAVRATGVVGTLLLTRFLSPAAYGAVSVAVTLVMTANVFSTMGLGQYIASRPTHDPKVAFHALVLHVILGVLSLSAVWLGRNQLSVLVNAPDAAEYVGVLCLGLLAERISYVPERVLLQRMRFREVSIARSSSVLAYTIGSVVLAVWGVGAASVVWGNILRFWVKLALIVHYSKRDDWLSVSRLESAVVRRMFHYGLPLSFSNLSTYISGNWDNLLVSRWFGPDVLGAYNLAYNLADTPATQIAEQAGDVLVPSYSQQGPEGRRRGFIRSLLALSMIVTPLAVGLGMVAPTLIAAVLDPRWSTAAPMLAILAVLSVARPPVWIGAAYLMSIERTRLAMMIELCKTVFLAGSLLTVGRWSPEWACVAIGMGFSATALVSMFFVRASDDDLPIRDILGAQLAPVGPVLGLVGGVLLARHVGVELDMSMAARLGLEISLGAMAYVLGALVMVPRVSRELIGSVRMALNRRMAPPSTTTGATTTPSSS